MAKSELMGALEQIAREKNIPVEEILSMIEGAVVSSLRKHVGKNADIRATIDRETGAVLRHRRQEGRRRRSSSPSSR